MTNRGYILFLDDDEARNPETTIQSPAREIVDGLRRKYPQADLVWVKTSQDFIDSRTLELPIAVSLDHDIGELGPEKETTGLLCAKSLCEICYIAKVPLPEFYCHSNNPPGKDNILGEFNFYTKHHPWMVPQEKIISQ